MIIVAGSLRVEPAERATYLEGCAAVVPQARQAPGCLDFALSADLVEDGRINVFERWESEAELTAFRGSGPAEEQQAVLLDADVRDYRLAPDPHSA